MSPAGFLELARAARCPGPGALLLALAAEFTGADPAEGDGTLDEMARPLFGLAGAEASVQAELLAAHLDGTLGLRAAIDAGPEPLLLDRVLESRRAHPLLLAAVGRELAARAGAASAVFVSRTRWFVGLTAGERPVVFDARLTPVCETSPGSVRPLCSHEMAFCVLSGLERRLLSDDRASDAERATALRAALPVFDGRHGAGRDPRRGPGQAEENPPAS